MAGRAGPVALGIFRSQLLERVESIWGPGLGAAVVAPPAEAAPDSFLEQGVGRVGAGLPALLLPPRPVCGPFSGTHTYMHTCVRPCGLGPALLPRPAQGPIFSPRL